MRKRHYWKIVWLLCSAGPLFAQDEGYRLTATRVVVDRVAHWEAWEGSIGSYEIQDEGRVAPRFLRQGINALLDAKDFETVVAGGDTIIGGLQAAGSNEETALQVMDGDPSTWWEPDRNDSLDQWFVDINLGRAVIARKVVVHFAEEGEGDPFLKFRVLLSDGREIAATGKRRGLDYYRAGQITRRNKHQRTFEFEVRPQRPVPAEVDGEVAQVVRFEALDSDGPKGEEIDPARYALLGPEDQGAIEYFRQTVAGRHILIDQETYDELPAEEQGPIRYYRHERPRLTELEVYAVGDNIVSLTQRLRNRESDLFENIVRALSTDGIYSSLYPLRVYDPVRDRNQLEIDLGAKYWLERIALLTPQEPLTAYQLRISDGTLDPSGVRLWQAFDERLNKEAFLHVEEQFPRQEVRFIELRRLELVGAQSETGSLSELQAYGEGYVSEVTLTSPIIRLPGSRMFTTMEWEGEVPVETRLEIRTRSGDDLTRIEQYFDIFGREISKEQWESIAERNRGEAIIEELPGPHWSNWSDLYPASGALFKSPSPRQMAMVQVRLLTRNSLRAATIRRLQLGLAPPLVDQTYAEIWPVEGVRPGIEQEFALYLKPVFGLRDPGFDTVRLSSSSSAPMELLSLRAGTEATLRIGAGRQLWPGTVQVEHLEDGGVELRFPQPVVRGSEIYVATFRTQLYLSGTTFSAALRRAIRPGVVQTVSEGDAITRIESQSLVVVADVESAPLLDQVELVPPVFTPNGDGVNDVTQVRFAIYRLKQERELQVRIHDLTGRQVRDLSIQRPHPSGWHAVAWDGRDEAGQLVGPGIYVVRVSFTTDVGAEGTEAVRLVHVVY